MKKNKKNKKTIIDKECDPDYQDVQKELQTSLKKFRSEGDKKGMAMAWYGLAIIDFDLARDKPARRKFEKAMRIDQRIYD